MPDGVQVEGGDRRVGVRPHPAVQLDDVGTRLSGRGPHVRVRLGILREPRQRLVGRPPERLAEVPELDARHVLDESEQVGARPCERAAKVIFGHTVELPQQRLARSLQVIVELGFRLSWRHESQPLTNRPRTLAPPVRTALRLGAYQLHFLHTPPHAAVSATLGAAGSQRLPDWLEDGQPKVVVRVPSLEALHELVARAEQARVSSSVIADAGRTELEAGTETCCAFGPDSDERLTPITGDLALL